MKKTCIQVVARIKQELDAWLPERAPNDEVTGDEVAALADSIDAVCEEFSDEVNDAELEDEIWTLTLPSPKQT